MVQLRDLKKYGLSEQYASVIMFLFRPEYYQKDMDGAFTTKGETHLRIAKNDMGPLDTVKLQADLGIQRFSKFEITEEL
jgi:replicative DNA helicase